MSKVNENKFPYKWNLKDGYPAKGITKNKCTVFGTFVCGGGSTMGYKLAGFSHLGGVELTSHYSDLYRANHRPLFFYEQDIRDFNKRNDIPKELYNIDSGDFRYVAYNDESMKEIEHILLEDWINGKPDILLSRIKQKKNNDIIDLFDLAKLYFHNQYD